MRDAISNNYNFPSNVENEIRITPSCNKANVFQWKKKLFKQMKGMPKDSPTSVVIADSAMQNTEKSTIETSLYTILMFKR